MDAMHAWGYSKARVRVKVRVRFNVVFHSVWARVRVALYYFRFHCIALCSIVVPPPQECRLHCGGLLSVPRMLTGA